MIKIELHTVNSFGCGLYGEYKFSVIPRIGEDVILEDDKIYKVINVTYNFITNKVEVVADLYE